MKKQLASLLTVAVLLTTVVVMLGVSSRAKAKTAVVPPPAAGCLTLADLPEILPIGGAVTPATLITRSAGEIRAGDVIVSAGGKQARGISVIPAGWVILYRPGRSIPLKFHIDQSVDIRGHLVMRYFAKRERGEDVQIGDVITGFDGKALGSERDFVSRAQTASKVDFIRSGVKMSRSTRKMTPVAYRAGPNKLVGECFECRPWTPGYCDDNGVCIERQDPTCPCGYCGVWFEEGDPNPLPEAHCCQVFV